MHIFCYKYTHLKRQKSITMTAANPTQRSGDSHTKKNYTCKPRIHGFYVFCIDECKAIILPSGTINCYCCCCCCCCCCILMSRYIFKRGIEGTVFFLNPWNGHGSLTKMWRWFVYNLYTKSVHKSTLLYLMYTWCIHKRYKQDM